MKKEKPKLSIEVARELRSRYQEGDSINSLSKRYSLNRRSVKLILTGDTYNKWGEHSNLMESKSAAKLF